MAKLLEYNATVVERIDHTEALASFKIQPDEALAGDPIFIPGQYVTLGMNNETRPELGSVRRPMSIASAPEEGQTLEFYIRYVGHPESDNPLTHLLWSTRTGDRLFMRPKAVGRFTEEHTVGADDPRHRICVAAGTGLAPFTSFTRSHLLSNPDGRLDGYTILHGASYPDDLAYRDELQDLAERKGLRYLPTVSRPQHAPDWRGDTGRVEDFFLPERLTALEEQIGLEPGGLVPSRAVIFICGLQGTIGKTIVRLIDRGFVPENRKLRRALEVPDDAANSLFFEQYDSTPAIDVDSPELINDLRARLHAALCVRELTTHSGAPMNLSKAIRTDFAKEVAATRATLAVIPEDQLGWQPHDKSMTLGRLAGHIAESPGWARSMVNDQVLDFATAGEEYKPFTATSITELLAAFDQQVAAFDALLDGQDDTHLEQTWAIHHGEQVLLETPRADALRTWVLHHIIHHRGQLSVYLRLLDVPLPAIYGNTADNPGFA